MVSTRFEGTNSGYGHLLYTNFKGVHLIKSYTTITRIKAVSLEGLFLANASNDFIFYQDQWSTTSSIKEKTNEFLGLAYHCLPLITNDITKLLDAATAGRTAVVLL